MKLKLMEKVVKISKIVPARSWYYMYAYTNDGNYFIYSHRDRVSFFGTHEAEDISNFQDTVTKLTTFKFFNENSENCLGNLAKVDFDKKTDNNIKFGTCLVSNDLQTNYKADVWVDNLNHEVNFKLHDAGEFAKNMTSDIQLPDPKETERLENKEARFQSLKTTQNEKLIELIYVQPKFFKRTISVGYPFSLEQIEKYRELIDWEELSNNLEIQWNEEVLSKFSDYLDWKNISGNKAIDWSIEKIERFKDKINWESFSKNINVDWQNIIPIYYQKTHWKELTSNESFPWTFENVQQFADKVDSHWDYLSENPALEVSDKLINEFSDKIDWSRLSRNKQRFWTEEFIDKYQDKLNWNSISGNPSLPWSLSFIKLYANKIDWITLSKNEGVCWSEYILDKYKEELAFGWLSENPGLPWTFELVEKYKDEWNWSNLGSNPGLPWTEEFIETNLEKFQNYNGTWSLWSNTGLPQNVDFWIKHKELLFPSHKGSGLMRVIDASNNDSLPISVELLYELKDNVDWDGYLFRTVKRTKKYRALYSQLNDDILDLILGTKHFEK